MIRCYNCGNPRRELLERGRLVPTEPPRPGDFWLCPCCGELHRFGPYRGIRGAAPMITLRPAELRELEVLDPEMRAELLKARDLLRRPN